MIRSFANSETSLTWTGQRSRNFPAEIEQSALRKLRMLDAATSLNDLANPTSNRLHALHGDRAGQHSISINMKFRICFVWKDGDAHDVEITNHYQ